VERSGTFQVGTLDSVPLDARLRAFTAEMDTPAGQLRRKLMRFVKAFNHGETRIVVGGIFPVDLLGLFESEIIRKHTDSELRVMLGILRE